MKTLICVILAALMAYMPMQAQVITNTTAPSATQQGKDPNSQMILCLLMLGCAAAGGYVIFHVWSSTCASCKNKKLVLYRDHMDDNWIPIATNYVAGVCTNKIEVFRDKMTEDTCRYRVEVLDVD